MEIQNLIRFSLKGNLIELTKEEAQDLVDSLQRELGNQKISYGPWTNFRIRDGQVPTYPIPNMNGYQITTGMD